MNIFFDNLKKTLSKKSNTAIILLLAIAGRAIQLVYFFNIRRDNAYQHIGTKNLLDGHGISMAKLIPEDISATAYDPLIYWPPGYSLLLSPFYVLYNGNYIAAGLTVSIIFALILIFYTRKILFVLDLPLYLVNCYTLISAFFIYPFYFTSSTDAIAISFAVVGVYYSLSLLQSSEKWGWRAIWMSASLIGCASIKYLFIPVVIIIPIFLIWKGFSEKQKQLLKAGVVSILIITIVVGSMLAWQKYIGGSATYIKSEGRGFFPGHLLDAYPYTPSAFVRQETATLFAAQSLKTPVISFLKVVNLTAIVIIGFLVARRILRRGVLGLSQAGNFFILSAALSLAITFLLAFLSLRVEKESFSATRLWTYVEEARYYGLATILVQLVFLVFYNTYRSKLSQIVRYGCYVLFLLLMVEMARGVLFDLNRISDFGKKDYGWQYEYKFQQYADNIIEKVRKKRPFEKVVVAGSSFYMTIRVGLYSDATVMRDPVTVDKLLSLRTKKTTLLLFILSKENFPTYKPFLDTEGVEFAGESNEFYFYTVYVNPQ